MNVQTDQLQKLNDLLTILRENESISPYYLMRKTKIQLNTIIQILNIMVDRSLLKISFILRCNNSDSDLVHGYEFENEDKLLNFLRVNDQCNQCDSNLLTKDIRVFYKKGKLVYGGDIYG